jgi:hypothetical protein
VRTARDPYLGACTSANSSSSKEIEATELDGKMLVAKLNEHGASHHLKFELVDRDFDYRIVFGTGQAPVMTTYGSMNSSGAMASVFDAKGSELFQFKRSTRSTCDSPKCHPRQQ